MIRGKWKVYQCHAPHIEAGLQEPHVVVGRNGYTAGVFPSFEAAWEYLRTKQSEAA